MPVGKSEDAVVLGTDPHRSAAVFPECCDELVRQVILSAEPGEHAILEPGQAAAGRTDPERTETIFEQRGDVVVAERSGVGSGEDLEAHSIEADEPLLGAEPQIPVARLQDGLDGILREPLIGLPHVVHVLGQCFVGIESERRRRPREELDEG